MIIESNDVDFYENKFPFKSRNSGGSATDHILMIRSSDENIESNATEPRRGKRARVAKEYGPDYLVYTLEDDPTSLQEALSSLDVDL